MKMFDDKIYDVALVEFNNNIHEVRNLYFIEILNAINNRYDRRVTFVSDEILSYYSIHSIKIYYDETVIKAEGFILNSYNRSYTIQFSGEIKKEPLTK